MNENCGVYIIINPNNKRYVGSSKSLNKRFNRYKNYSCSRQSAILASLKKYGHENHKFKILINCEEKDLLFWERVFGDIYLSSANFPNGLNITLPGYNDVPQVRADEFKKRVSDIQKNRFSNPEERIKTSLATKNGFTDEVKRKMSDLHKKRFENIELRKQRSSVRKEYYQKNPEARIRASEITKKNIEKNPNLRKIAADTFKKYYEQNPEARKMKQKKVINIETGEVFIGISEILHLVGVTRKVMQNRLKGYTKNITPYRYL